MKAWLPFGLFWLGVLIISLLILFLLNTDSTTCNELGCLWDRY